MKSISLILILFIGCICYAQKCIILDKDSEFTIQNVQVRNEDNSKHAISDKDGRIDLSIFSEMELLTFMHVGYVELELLKNKI